MFLLYESDLIYFGKDVSQEVIGKLSQIRQLNPLYLYDHMWWS